MGSQIKGALTDLSAEQVSQIVIAYEPIWAIGTGRAAEPAAVNQIIVESIREVVAGLYDEATAQARAGAIRRQCQTRQCRCVYGSTRY